MGQEGLTDLENEKMARSYKKPDDDLIADFHAWLDDIDAGNSAGNTSDIDEALVTIEAQLPPFCLRWTVEELISAFRDR